MRARGRLLAALLPSLALCPAAPAADASAPSALRGLVELVNTWNGRVFCAPRGTRVKDIADAVTAFSMVHPELGDPGNLNAEQQLRALALRYPCEASQVAPRGPDARLRQALRDGDAPLVIARPVFGELLWLSLPAGFQAQPVREDVQDGQRYLAERVPQGETADQWREKLTIRAERGLAARQRELTPKAYLAATVASWKAACPESFAGTAMPAGQVSGHEAYAAIVSCGTAPADPGAPADGAGEASESALLVAIRGSEDFYTLQWSQRGQAWSTPLTIDTQPWIERLARLAPVKLCPLVPSEQAPYPSCIAHP